MKEKYGGKNESAQQGILHKKRYWGSVSLIQIDYDCLNRSYCELKKTTCGQRVVAVPLHHCATTAACNQVCGEERKFVCGSDNKFYRNDCEMKRDNCGLVVFFLNKSIIFSTLLAYPPLSATHRLKIGSYGASYLCVS